MKLFETLFKKLQNTFDPDVEITSEKLDVLAKTKARQFCNDRYEGKRLTSEQVYYLLEKTRVECKEMLLERANRHSEYAKRLSELAEQENHRANVATTTAGMLT